MHNYSQCFYTAKIYDVEGNKVGTKRRKARDARDAMHKIARSISDSDWFPAAGVKVRLSVGSRHREDSCQITMAREGDVVRAYGFSRD